jgi:hypothetical protein
LNKTASHTIFGPYTNFSGDPRDQEGLMHFTKEQVEAINMFRRVQSYMDRDSNYVRRKIKIINMHNSRK